MSARVGEIQISMGNSASVVALVTAAFWNIDCVFLTSRGNPVAVLKSARAMRARMHL
jgi:hypothetical protein